MIRVTLPAHLRTLAKVDGEVQVLVEGQVTSSTINAPIVRARHRSGNPATVTAAPSVRRSSVARLALMNSSSCSVIHRATRSSPS